MRSSKSAAILAAAVSVALSSVASAEVMVQPQSLKERDLRLVSVPFTLDNGPAFSGGGSAREALVVWNAPNTGNWSVGSNWVGGTPPVAADDLQFAASGTQSYTANNDTALTYGAVQIANTGTGTIGLTGGVNANHLRIDQGAATIGAGTYTLSSLSSVGVGTTSTNQTMSLTVGNVAGSASATFNGATVNARNAFIGNDPGATAVGTFNGGTYNFLPTNVLTGTDGGRLGVNLGNGTINIQGGANVTAWLFEAGRNPGSVTVANISGTGTTVTANQLAMSRVDAGTSTVNISNNAVLNINYRTSDGTPNGTVNTGGSVIARSGGPGGVTNINVTSGGKFFNRGNTFLASGADGVGDPADDTHNLTVSGSGSRFEVIRTYRPSDVVGGQLVLASGEVINTPSTGATGNANITNGGYLSSATWFSAIRYADVANVNVSGAGSKVEVFEFAVLSGGGGAGVAGGQTFFNVTNGGNFTAGDVLIGNNGSTVNPSSRGTLTVSGTGSSFVTVDDAGDLSDGQVVVANGANTRGTLTIENNATATLADTIFSSINATAESTITVQTNAVMTVGGQAQFGGSGGTNGGKSLVDVKTGGTLTSAGLMSLYTGARMNVNAGTVVSGGQFSAGNNPALPSGQYTVDVTNAGTLTVGSLSTPASAFFSSDATENSRVRVDGANSQVLVTRALVLSGGAVDGVGDPLPGGITTVDITNGGNVTAYDILAATYPSGTATINVTGANSKLVTVNTTTDDGDLIMTFAGTGTGGTASLTVGSGGLVEVGGNVLLGSNATVNINAGGTMHVKGGLSTTFGTVTGSGTVFNVNSGGLLKGGGVVSLPTGNAVAVKSGGKLAPGDGTSIGDFVSTGDLNLEAGSTLEVELATSSSYDSANAVRNIAMNGSVLEIKLLPGFTATPTDQLIIVDAFGTGSSRTGTFSNLNAWGLITTTAGNSAFLPVYSSTQVILTDFATRGDIDRDGVINNQDIAPFVAVLTGGTLTPPSALGFASDINGDGVVNNQDIAPFVALLTGSRPLSEFASDPDFAPLIALVPEPASLSLLALGGLALRRRRRA
jgi:hypothetical protein